MTREEWYEHCMERGTRGDQVFSILKAWKEYEMSTIEVVEAARAVVAFLDLCCREDPIDVTQIWDMIDVKLRKALGE